MTADPAPPPAAYRFTFDAAVPLTEAEATLRLAILAVEGLFGEAQVRLDASYQVDPQARAITVDASTPVGSALAAVFAALAFREFSGRAVVVGRTRAETGEEVAS